MTSRSPTFAVHDSTTAEGACGLFDLLTRDDLELEPRRSTGKIAGGRSGNRVALLAFGGQSSSPG